MKQISVADAARIVGVSAATIRNWAKAGHINPVCARPLSFQEGSIWRLKNKIGSDSFGKLRTRANKTGSANNTLPTEYAENADLIAHVGSVVTLFKSHKLHIEPLLFLAALRLLEARGELKRCETADIFNLCAGDSWARESVRDVMTGWSASLEDIGDKNKYLNIYSLLTPYEGDDFLGLLYQSLSSEGSKSGHGAYYTPSIIVENALGNMTRPIETFLDPCCGTGKYLIIAAKKLGLHPRNIYGFDSDRIAANIARINLLLAFSNAEFAPNITCLDSLSELATGEKHCETNALTGKIDVIATNPPWGAYKNSLIPKEFADKIKSGETYSMFLAKSLALLRKGGQLSFLLPESILKVRAHSDIREILLRQASITKITKLGRQFTGVFTSVIRLDAIKETSDDRWLIAVEENRSIHHVEQTRFRKNAHFTFDVETTRHEEGTLNNIYSVRHETLSGNAAWALGIVTGDNNKYVLTTKDQGTEQIYRGSDVHQFNLGQPNSFIRFTPKNFQQVAPERFYRAPEKLIYKFISRRLVFAYDNRQRLTLNSANILIPDIPGMSIKVVLAFLNSSVFQYLHRKKFSTHKILRGDLEKLPFPVIGKGVHDEIERLVDSALSDGKIPTELESLIFSTFNLTDSDISAIMLGVRE